MVQKNSTESLSARHASANAVHRRLASAALRVFAGSGVSKFCLIGAELLLAAILGAAGYGQFSIAFSCLLVVSVLTQLGLSFGVIQYLSIYTEQQNEKAKAGVARGALLSVFITATGCAIALAFASNWLAVTLFGQPGLAILLKAAAFVIPFEAANQIFSAIFRGLRKFKLHVMAQDLIRNVSLLLIVAALFMGVVATENIFYFLACGAALSCCVSIIVLSRSFSLICFEKQDFKILRELFAFSYLLFFWQALQKTATDLMVLVSGAVLVATEVGILALAVRFLTLLSFPQSVVNATAPVEFARLYHRQEYGEISRLFQVLAFSLSVISLLFVFVIGFNAEFIFTSFGPEYSGYGWVLQILLVAKAIDVGSGPSGQILIASRKTTSVFIIGVIDVTLQFLLVVPMMYSSGLTGAAIGNAIRGTAIVILRHGVLFQRLRVHGMSKPLFLTVGFAVLLFFCGYFAMERSLSFSEGVAVSLLTATLFLFFVAFISRRKGMVRRSLYPKNPAG